MAEQFTTCHAQVSRWFAMAEDDEEYEFAARIDALKLATRLVQASAAAARAVTQIKGEFHHHIHVMHPDYKAEKAAKKARETKKTQANSYEARKAASRAIDLELKRHAEVEFGKLTPEERATVSEIWARADARTNSGPSMLSELARGSEWWKKPYWAENIAKAEEEEKAAGAAGGDDESVT
jgi:hypothetical protein